MPLIVQGGRMTQYMEKMEIGDSIDVKGPLGHFVYKGKGIYSHHGREGKVKQMSMIAGGTGITPMWQVIQVIALIQLLHVARQSLLNLFYNEYHPSGKPFK